MDVTVFSYIVTKETLIRTSKEKEDENCDTVKRVRKILYIKMILIKNGIRDKGRSISLWSFYKSILCGKEQKFILLDDNKPSVLTFYWVK